MERLPCAECPMRQAMISTADELDNLGNEAQDRIRAACRAAGLDPLLEAALAGPAPGGELPDNSNTDVGRFASDHAWLQNMNHDDALRAVFKICLELNDELLEGFLADIDARFLRNVAEIMPKACILAAPSRGIRFPLLGLVRVPGIRTAQCASYIGGTAARNHRRIRARYGIRNG